MAYNSTNNLDEILIYWIKVIACLYWTGKTESNFDYLLYKIIPLKRQHQASMLNSANNIKERDSGKNVNEFM